jgi:hypothetical protein
MFASLSRASRSGVLSDMRLRSDAIPCSASMRRRDDGRCPGQSSATARSRAAGSTLSSDLAETRPPSIGMINCGHLSRTNAPPLGFLPTLRSGYVLVGTVVRWRGGRPGICMKRIPRRHGNAGVLPWWPQRLLRPYPGRRGDRNPSLGSASATPAAGSLLMATER